MRDIPKYHIEEIIRYFAIKATDTKSGSISFRQYAYDLGEFYMQNIAHPQFYFYENATDESKDFADKKLRYHFFKKKELDELLWSAAIGAMPEPDRTDCMAAIDNLLNPQATGEAHTNEHSALKLVSKLNRCASDEMQALLKIVENGIGDDDTDEDLLEAEVMLTKSIEASREALAAVQTEKKKRNLKNIDLKAV